MIFASLPDADAALISGGCMSHCSSVYNAKACKTMPAGAKEALCAHNKFVLGEAKSCFPLEAKY